MKNFYTFTKKTSSLIISIIFLLIFSANYSTAQPTTCYPASGNYNTGSTDGSNFTQTSSMVIMSNGVEQAWAKFDISAIPDGATISSVQVYWYITNTNCPYFDITHVANDPLIGTAASVYADIIGGTQYYNHASCPATGWNNVALGNGVETDLQNALSSDWFAIGFYEYEGYGTYTFTADGWNETNVPYIVVNWSIVSCISTYPYSENFDSPSPNWTPSPTSGSVYRWTHSTDCDGNATPSSNTGPSCDHGGSGGFYFTEASYGSSGNITTLTSICFDLTVISSPELSFWYHMYGSTMGTLQVEISTGGPFTSIWSISGQQHTSFTDPWTQHSIDISSYVSSNTIIRFHGTSAGTYTGDMSIDDIEIYEGVALPTGLWSGTTSTDWATPLNWDDGLLPIASTNVTIPASATNWPTFSGDFELGSSCNSIILMGTSIFTVTGDINIPTGYTITCNSTATIILGGDWNKYGDFIAGTGTVEFNGNTNSIIAGTPLKSNNTKTLELSTYKSGVIYENSFNEAEYDINAKPNNLPPSDVTWDLQFSYDVDTPSGLTGIAGSETDGTFLYGTKWSGTGQIVKFDLAGNFIETFTIPGVVNVRDLAYDGQYFYGSNLGSYIYEMDFVSKTLISTITTPAAVRSIAYDSDLDGFWYNNFNTDLHFVSRSGTLLNTITAPPSMYGSAYDNLSSGGPYLWIFTGTGAVPDVCQVEQYDISTKTLTGLTHSVSGDLGAYIAGGLWLQPNLVTGTYTLGGMAQGTPDLVFGYELGSSPDFYNLVSNKTNAEVLLDRDVQVNNNLTIKEQSYVTNSTGTTLTISNGKLVVESDAVGSGSFIDYGTVIFNNGAETNVERYTITDRWHMFSPSVSGETADIFHFGASTGYDVWLMKHDEPTDSYTYIWDETTPLYTMQGYFLWGGGTGATPPVTDWIYQMYGGLNSGSMGSVGNATRTSPGTGSGWNLLGNPYPSVIDWDAASGWTKTNIDATIYIHNGTNWSTYTYGGSSTNGGSRYISMGQGFFVSVSEGVSTGTLMMDNGVRVHNGVGYLKSEIDNELKLQAVGNNFTDETVIVFNEDATLGFDSQFDAYKLQNLEADAPAFYSVANENLAVNVLPAVDWVQLGFQAGVNGEYTISATEIRDIPTVFLEDTFTGEFTDLTSGSYTFVYSTNDNPNRFIVHFSPLSTPENASGLLSIYSYNKDVYVSVPENTNGHILVYDMIGQEVAETNINSSLNVIRLEKGAYYIVKVQSEKSIQTKKVLIK